MLKKKFYLKDIKKEDEDNYFTDGSYVIIDIPSMKEKLSLRTLCRGKSEEEIENISFERIYSMIIEVCVETIEGDIITDMDHLSVYPISSLIEFLGELLKNGYVPKKIKSC